MEILKRVFVIFFAVGLTSAGLTSFAAPGPAVEAGNPEVDPKPSFETVDANLDGVITLDEAKGSWLASVFVEVDANEDGLVNRDEYETAIG
jgi:hypothetical protein